MEEILIVDDDRVIREGLKAELQGEGFGVRTARDGEDALKKIAEQRPTLVLLDIMMPKMNGFCCCENIRRTDALLPVIFLTAKDTEADQVRGLGLGADDYVSKDASSAVLLARINRALARMKKIGAAQSGTQQQILQIGNVIVNARTLEVIENDKEISRLTKTEAGILTCLIERRGEMVPFDELISYLRGSGFACEDQMLYTHVSRLRGKIGKAGDLIATTRRVGYGILG